MLHRLCAGTLALCMMFTLFAGQAYAADAAEGADLVICTADELAAFRDAVNEGDSYSGKHVVLAADIELGGDEDPWTMPIGSLSTNAFAGTFDGNGYKISAFCSTNRDCSAI